MTPGHIEGANALLRAPLGMDNCEPLHIRIDTVDNQTYMSSEWVLTAAERDAIAAGAPVTLIVVGKGHPPVALVVNDTLRRSE